jgi:hypothetical protein
VEPQEQNSGEGFVDRREREEVKDYNRAVKCYNLQEYETHTLSFMWIWPRETRSRSRKLAGEIIELREELDHLVDVICH